MNDIAELKRQGLSIQAISAMTSFDRKTVRKYLRDPAARPEYKARPPEPSKLDAFKPYLEERMKAGVSKFRGRALVGEELACEAHLMCAMRQIS